MISMLETHQASDAKDDVGSYLSDPAFKSCKASELPPVVSNKAPHVLISGAGFAGLFLAIVLEKANIPYEIFERAKEVVPLGSVMCITPNILAVFEQLGIYEEAMRLSFPCTSSQFFTADMKQIGYHTGEGDKELTGYNSVLFARPDLYKLLRDRVPSHKIHMSKRVLNFLQNHEGVMVRLHDGTSVHGDILVGADGAYSAVRQHLFKDLSDQKKLPISDERMMNKGYICLVGIAIDLDPAHYPGLEGPTSDSFSIIGDKASRYAWSVLPLPNNRMSWGVVVQLDAETSANEQFRNSEWTSVSNKTMIDDVYHFRTPFGILGDLIDATPSELVSRVFLEDMLYETWHHGRTVLIGDAAHKLLPSAGQGAVNAMQDAVILANCLYDLKPMSFERIQMAFKDYRAQRYPHVKTQYEASHFAAKLQYGHTWQERMFRHFVFHYLPKAVQKNQVIRESQYRPQITFLPRTPNRGTGSVQPQKPSKRYTMEQTRLAAAARAARVPGKDVKAM